jgi:hypothetical protein
MAAQECDCNFNSSGDTYFEAEQLEYYTANILDPIGFEGPKNDIWVWEHPVDQRSYMVVVDTAKGDGSDSSGIQVLDIYSGAQASEYKGDSDTSTLSKMAVALAVKYNSALLVVENTGLGHATMSMILEIGYNNIYYSPKGDTLNVSQYMTQFYEYDISRMTPGFTTSTKTRPEVLLAMKSYVRDHSIQIRSKRTVNEMQTFVWKNGKAQAQTGYNDDLIMSYSIGLYLRDSAIQYRAQGLDMQRAVLNSMQKSTTFSPVNQLNEPKVNPYQMNVNGQMEDITWLI